MQSGAKQTTPLVVAAPLLVLFVVVAAIVVIVAKANIDAQYCGMPAPHLFLLAEGAGTP